jgi:hypothetical protein
MRREPGFDCSPSLALTADVALRHRHKADVAGYRVHHYAAGACLAAMYRDAVDDTVRLLLANSVHLVDERQHVDGGRPITRAAAMHGHDPHGHRRMGLRQHLANEEAQRVDVAGGVRNAAMPEVAFIGHGVASPSKYELTIENHLPRGTWASR